MTVPPGTEVERFDRAALRWFGAIATRSQARKLAKAGRLTLNGREEGSARYVHPGDVLTLALPELGAKAYRRPIPLVLQDRWLAVAHKPPGLATRAAQHRTLQHALAYQAARSPEPDALPSPDPVHRLDARTSGLVVCARTAGARKGLGLLFETRRITKRYQAIVLGHLEGEGRVDAPLDGREAASRWKTLRHCPSLHVPEGLTEVALWPETGRTHQLRRHMADLGHPILGDSKYFDGKVLRGQGLFLCAVAVAFAHPVTGEPVDVAIPPPAKFDAFLTRESRRHARWLETHGRLELEDKGDDSEASRALGQPGQ